LGNLLYIADDTWKAIPLFHVEALYTCCQFYTQSFIYLLSILTYMDKATNIAAKQRNKLAAKEIPSVKNKKEPLTHAEVQALVSSANSKKLIDEAKRTLLDIVSQLEQRLAATEKEVKELKKSKGDK